CEQVALKVVRVYEAASLACNLVLAGFVLPRVADEDAVADRLDPERRIAVLKLRIDERAWRRDQMPSPVEDVDACVVEIGRVKQRLPRRRLRDREALVDRAASSRGGDESRRRRAPPGADHPVLTRKDEVRTPRRRPPPPPPAAVTRAAVDVLLQARIIPSSLAKMKFDVPSVVGLAVVPTWNWPAIPENTAPVGSPGTPCAGRPPMSTRAPAPV